MIKASIYKLDNKLGTAAEICKKEKREKCIWFYRMEYFVRFE
jgi:hypothetical protein